MASLDPALPPMEDAVRDAKVAAGSQSAVVSSGSKTVARTPLTTSAEAAGEEYHMEDEVEEGSADVEQEGSSTPDDSVGLKRKLAFDEVRSASVNYSRLLNPRPTSFCLPRMSANHCVPPRTAPPCVVLGRPSVRALPPPLVQLSTGWSIREKTTPSASIRVPRVSARQTFGNLQKPEMTSELHGLTRERRRRRLARRSTLPRAPWPTPRRRFSLTGGSLRSLRSRCNSPKVEGTLTAATIVSCNVQA